MKEYTVRYTYKNLYDDFVGGAKQFTTEEEARTFAEYIKTRRKLVYLAIDYYEKLI